MGRGPLCGGGFHRSRRARPGARPGARAERGQGCGLSFLLCPGEEGKLCSSRVFATVRGGGRGVRGALGIASFGCESCTEIPAAKEQPSCVTLIPCCSFIEINESCEFLIKTDVDLRQN